jgi:branched-chain amino acid transport system substrate-binding protein
MGLVAPYEGRYRAIGYDVIYAVRLALSEVNQTGGVAGHAVELVAYDDGAQPAMAIEQARKLDVDPQVLAAVGHFREETTLAAVGVYGQARLPLVAPAVLTPHLSQDSRPLYRLGPPAPVLAHALLDRAAQLTGAQAERSQRDDAIVLVSQGGPLGASLQDLASQRQAGDPGWRLSAVSAAAPDWRKDVLARNPAVVLCDLDPVLAGEVVASLRQGGWSGPVLGGPALAASDFAAVAGQAARGATFVTPWPFPLDVPGGDVFAAAYRSASDGVEPGPLALPAYEATWMLLEGLEQAAAAGELTRRGVGAALSGVERDGLLGHIALNGEGAWTAESLYWYQIGPQGAPRLVETAPRADVSPLAPSPRSRETG